MSKTERQSRSFEWRSWPFRRNFISLLRFLAAVLILQHAIRADPATASTNAPKSTVVIVENPQATTNYVPSVDTIRRMLHSAVMRLARKKDFRAAWLTFVSPGDVVGLKVFSEPGQNSGTRPEVVEAVVEDLLAVGLPAKNIVIWDSRAFELRFSGFFELERKYHVRVLGSVDAGYDDKVFYESPLLGTLNYSDHEFGLTNYGVGRKSFVSKLVSRELTKIINITPLLHHNTLGVTGNLYSLAFGSVDNTTRFENNPETSARVVPEIWALPIKGDDRLSDHVALNIVDALYCQYEGQHQAFLHYSVVLNQLRLSRDPVALDVLSLDEINRQRKIAGSTVSTNKTEMFYNASLLELGTSEPAQINIEKVQ